MLSRQAKREVVSEVAQAAGSAHSILAAAYHGISATQMTELRAQARAMGVHVRVIKNSLARRSLEGTDYACMQDRLEGPLIFMFSRNEPSDAARLTKQFLENYEDALQVKLIALPGQLLNAEKFEALASLPTQQGAIARLAAALQAPVAKLAGTLSDVSAKLVRSLRAVNAAKR